MPLPKIEQLPRADITGSPVTALPLKDQVAIMVEWAKRCSSRVVCVANVHMLMESYWDISLRKVLESADLVTPDGMPLVWMMKAMGFQSQDRVAGMDIFLSACQQAAEHNISIYLLGSTQDVLHRMQERLKEDFPTLKIAGVESPPFRPLTQAEDAELVERINSSGAGFTFVSLGCPKQEYWMADHYGKIQSVMVGIGGVFPVYAGIKKHAPKWVRDNGLEWLYRLVQEPRRLAKRYLTTIPPFMWLAVQQITSRRKTQQRLFRF
ncbi:MAG: WecB/TagA/CpsF family glycosyltransferase [Elainellaceae cyanobacterium]